MRRLGPSLVIDLEGIKLGCGWRGAPLTRQSDKSCKVTIQQDGELNAKESNGLDFLLRGLQDRKPENYRFPAAPCLAEVANRAVSKILAPIAHRPARFVGYSVVMNFFMDLIQQLCRAQHRRCGLT